MKIKNESFIKLGGCIYKVKQIHTGYEKFSYPVPVEGYTLELPSDCGESTTVYMEEFKVSSFVEEATEEEFLAWRK